MSTDLTPVAKLESRLAGLLHYGTWLASLVIGAGLIVALFDPGTASSSSTTGMRIVALGIALFILLPMLRVALMLIGFLRERDYRFAAIAALVLAIILLGLAVGLSMSASRTLA